MKTLKISMVALVALVLAIGASAFTRPAETSKKTTDVWFIYDEGAQDNQDSYYKMVSQGDPGCASLDEIVCAVRLPESTEFPGKPDQDALEILSGNTHDFTEMNDNVQYKAVN